MRVGAESGLAGLWIALTIAVGCTVFAPPAAAKSVTASTAKLNGDAARTTFALAISQGVTAEIFTLANPYRVIIDLPNVVFRLPDGAGSTGRGLVSQFRYGLFAPGKARIVLDTTKPVRIAAAEMRNASGGGVSLELALAPVDAKTFGRGTGARRKQTRSAKRSAPNTATLPERKPQRPRGSKPVIVIDPGHGGIDPGALGASKVLEKDVVLKVARVVADALRATGRYKVLMTRNKDVFISLDKRLAFSEKHRADLFISLHADSLASKRLAQSIRGATVYTLSERASDEEARKRAEAENSSDRLAGLDTSDSEAGGQVRSILFDLMKRETANFSTDFSRRLITSLRKSVAVSRSPRRSAAFKVLRQTNTPSVLVELGYLSNLKDEKELQSSAWRRKVAKSIVRAVNAFFRRGKGG